MKPETTLRAKLVYPSSQWGDPPVAECEVTVRLTPTQIVVTDADPRDIRYINGNTAGPTGIANERYRRDNGRKFGLGRYSLNGWRFSPDELARLNALRKDGAA
jgi:hypothetical protein